MRLTATIAERPGPHRPGVWAGFLVPDDLVAAIAPDATGRRVPVVVTLGDIAYRSALTRREDGWEFIASLDFRQRTSTGIGDEIEVDIALDTEARTIEPPNDVAEALLGAGLTGWFEGLPYSHQRELMLYIDDSKRPETRVRRIQAMLDSAKRKPAPRRTGPARRHRA